MTQIVLDSSALAKLGSIRDSVEVCDESGRVVGLFRPALSKSDLEQMARESPFSETELQTIWHQDRVGRPLADILRELAAG